MSYSFNPMTDEEIDSFNLLQDGVYSFSVEKSTKKISKSGNPMAELLLKIWDKEGKVHIIYDYLVFSTIPLNIKKIKHFCEAVGLSDAYSKGELPEELENYSGNILIGVQEARPNPNGGMYPKKNVVIDYVMKEATNAPANDEFKDDEIPF